MFTQFATISTSRLAYYRTYSRLKRLSALERQLQYQITDYKIDNLTT